MPTIYFTHKKGTEIPPRKEVRIQVPDTNHSLRIKSPNWVTTYAQSREGKMLVGVHPTAVETLPVGTHTGKIIVEEWTNHEPGSPIEPKLISVNNRFDVHLTLNPRIPTVVSPSRFDFYYKIGTATAPSKQQLKITSEHNYTITADKHWLVVSATSGSGNKTVDVSVKPNGLVPGTYTAVIVVEDDKDRFSIPLEFVIDAADGGEDYLFIDPDTHTFEFVRYGFLPSPKNISVNASKGFIITAAASYIDVSVTSGNEHTLSFDISVNRNVDSLGIGLFVSDVVLRLGAITKVVKVYVRVEQFMEEVFSPDDLYFTDDDNTIVLASSAANTQLSVLINTSYRGEGYRFEQSVPFFRGKSSTHVGSETRAIIGETIYKKEVTADIYIPYSVVFLDFQITENIMYTDIIKRGLELKNIPFIKGEKPKTKRLSTLPDKIYLTPKGMFSISFLADEVPRKMEVTGDDRLNFVVNNAGVSPFYTLVMSMRYFNNTTIGSEFNIKVGNQQIQVQLKPPGPDHCILVWENIWGCFDYFECTGEIKNAEKYSRVEQIIQETRTKQRTDVLDVRSTESFEIDTGWIYSREEALFLRSIYDSKNIYIIYQGEEIPVKIQSTPFLIPGKHTRKLSYKLTFKKRYHD